VDHFVIERNADIARKHAVTEPITKKGALDPGLLHEDSGSFVDLFG
jgi:hypothetical protein